ncbi:lmo0937 family membrane protein [Clostridium bowmanii]|uniref:lmo0937 family membrane protein n=1 Tax=Clostridium bowmanii TaxID=132925 RepID=UPI001C0D3543|nr:lmo0937 family membrane protein [Clostridium bowmanii]MBU3188784.1 lmo0937 family membrane protein [Clostridium bowmanii]MCA1073368.1 lmo0937 family membrane protein [Clostridium bowmanii]
MVFLRWIGGIIVFFWVLGLILRIGGSMIHLLLIIAVIVFIIDLILGKGKRT